MYESGVVQSHARSLSVHVVPCFRVVMYESGVVQSHARSLWKLEHVRTK